MNEKGKAPTVFVTKERFDQATPAQRETMKVLDGVLEAPDRVSPIPSGRKDK